MQRQAAGSLPVALGTPRARRPWRRRAHPRSQGAARRSFSHRLLSEFQTRRKGNHPWTLGRRMYRFQTLVTSYTYRSESSLRYCTVLRAYRVRMYAHPAQPQSSVETVPLWVLQLGLQATQVTAGSNRCRSFRSCTWLGDGGPGADGRDIYLAYLVV